MEGSGRANKVPFSKTGDREEDKVTEIEGFFKAILQAQLNRPWLNFLHTFVFSKRQQNLFLHKN
jgi:hypothetical protein